MNQNLVGVDAATFNDDTHNPEAFSEAVAMAMPPLTSDNIAISDVVDHPVSDRRLRGLTTDAVDITYWVTYTVAETGYNDAQTAYNALIASLNTAVVETDLFNGYISVVAAQDSVNAPDLVGTTSNSYTATEATQVGTDDDSKPNTRNHNKLIVGLLVGLGGGLLLIALIAYCIFGRGEESSAAPSSTPGTAVASSAIPQSLTAVDPTAEKSAI